MTGPDKSLRNRRFREAWSRLEATCACDGIGGAEYKRVRKEWREAGYPDDIERFITGRCNYVPKDPSPTQVKMMFEATDRAEEIRRQKYAMTDPKTGVVESHDQTVGRVVKSLQQSNTNSETPGTPTTEISTEVGVGSTPTP